MASITKRDLEICASLAREIANIRERIERLREMLTGSAAVISKDPPSTDRAPDKMAQGVACLVDMEEDAQHRIAAYLAHAQMVEAAIDGVSEPNTRRVLRLRYVDGLAWGDVAKKMYYSERWCQMVCADGERELLNDCALFRADM